MIRVYWHLSAYISHRRAGEAYRRCLSLAGCETANTPEDADLTVLHDEPHLWPAIFESTPVLREKPVAGYTVWESEALPEAYLPGLRLVREIWTASAFSASAFRQGHDRVRVLPHVVEPVEPSAEDLSWAGNFDRPYFFTIMDAVNPRKNLSALLRVFSRVRSAAGGGLRLVIKQYRAELPLGGLPGVVSIGGELSEGRMAALHRGALAYVSPHRSEAWGLGLSEAMSHGVCVLATGWSGNMEFMDEGNSIPLKFTLEPVGERTARMLPYFRPDMRWAAVDERHLEREMLRLVRRGPDPKMCAKARAVAERFSPARVAQVLRRLGRAASGERP